MKDGQYNYRFSGHAMKGGLPFVIVGLGNLQVEGGEITNGSHRSSLARLQGSGSELTHAHFQVTGEIAALAGDEGWSITLEFVEQNAPANRPAQLLTGGFHAVEAGADRYWIISIGAVNRTGGQSTPATEVVHGEVVFVG